MADRATFSLSGRAREEDRSKDKKDIGIYDGENLHYFCGFFEINIALTSLTRQLHWWYCLWRKLDAWLYKTDRQSSSTQRTRRPLHSCRCVCIVINPLVLTWNVWYWPWEPQFARPRAQSQSDIILFTLTSSFLKLLCFFSCFTSVYFRSDDTGR